MVSGKDGTVTRTNMQYGNVSANNVASTKYVDDMSSGIKSEIDPLPQGIKSASVVKTANNGGKRDTNGSQNTMMVGEMPATINPVDGEMSQIEMNGISIPNNESTLHKVSAEQRTKDNNSTL